VADDAVSIGLVSTANSLLTGMGCTPWVRQKN
jgi:hypothetical protein